VDEWMKGREEKKMEGWIAAWIYRRTDDIWI
jgi:hypothetical protein